ncbi:MAG: hypothetical protein ACR2KC_04330 [Acidimicrobiales bacterium]
MKRVALAALAGLVLAGAAAVILGEYPFTGWTPYLAAAIVPLVLWGALSAIVDRPGPSPWVAAGVLSSGGLAWAVWISTGHGLDPVPAGGWAAIGSSLVWPLAAAARAAQLRQRGRPKGGGASGGAGPRVASDISEPPAR